MDECVSEGGGKGGKEGREAGREAGKAGRWKEGRIISLSNGIICLQ